MCLSNVCVTMNKYWYIYINTCMFVRGCNFLFVYTHSTSPYIIQFNIYNYHIMHMYILPGTLQLLSFNFLSPLRKPSTFGFWGQKSPQKPLILVINPNDGEKSPSYLPTSANIPKSHSLPRTEHRVNADLRAAYGKIRRLFTSFSHLFQF